MDLIINEDDISSLYLTGNEGKGLDALRRMGLIPFYISNPHFPDINLITGFNYFSGSIEPRTFKVSFSCEDSVRDILESRLSYFGLKPALTSKHCSYNLIGEGSKAFGRFLYALGVPAGNKVNQALRLPDYIIDVLDSPDKQELIYLSDFASALLSSKLTVSKKHYCCIRFTSVKEEYIKDFSYDIRNLLYLFDIESYEYSYHQEKSGRNYFIKFINIAKNESNLLRVKKLLKFSVTKNQKLNK